MWTKSISGDMLINLDNVKAIRIVHSTEMPFEEEPYLICVDLDRRNRDLVVLQKFKTRDDAMKALALMTGE